MTDQMFGDFYAQLFEHGKFVLGDLDLVFTDILKPCLVGLLDI